METDCKNLKEETHMPDWKKLTENLERHGFAVSRFATGWEAAEYINASLDGKSIGIGGSMTVQELGLYELLAAHNQVHWHWGPEKQPDTLAKAAQAEVYLTSVNGLAETGELINIDGTCNRVSASIYGHKTVLFVVGVNKIAPDYEKALWRARNIASPKNAQRLGRKTPCAVKGDRCYDCQSPERICRALVTLWQKPTGVEKAEVVLVEEELGY
jgi:L-lactate utilization protein LutB